jgi:hypothetical protein
MKPMSPEEYGRALDRLEFSNRGFSFFIGVNERTGRAWLAGDSPIPGSVAAFLRLCVKLKLTSAKLRELLR